MTLIAVTNDASDALSDTFWPGALTVVLPKRAAFSTLAAAGGDTIAVRVPDDSAIREMALQLGPLTGPSANRSDARMPDRGGRPCTIRDEVDLIVEAPLPATSIPSMIVDCTDLSDPRIVRAGAIGPECIASALEALRD